MVSKSKKRHKLSPGAVVERYTPHVVVEAHRHLTFNIDKTSRDFLTTITPVAHPVPPSTHQSVSSSPSISLTPYLVEQLSNESEDFVTYTFTAPNLDNNPDLPHADGSDWNNVEIGSHNVCSLTWIQFYKLIPYRN